MGDAPPSPTFLIGERPIEPDYEVGLAASGRSRTWRALRANPSFWVGASLVAAMLLLAVFAPLIAPYDPIEQFRDDGLTIEGSPVGPSAKFPLGTDSSGRDMSSRLVHGARISLTIGVVGTAIATFIGVFVGAVAGWIGTARVGLAGHEIGIPVEGPLMRLTDLALSFPALLFALAMTAVFGRGPGLVIFLIAVLFWASIARIVYGRVLILRTAEFIEAARAVGVPGSRILVRHVLPHVGPLILVYASLGVAVAILFETTLSYLGSGVPAPTPTWGTMIADHITWFYADPRLVFLPGMAITLTVLAFSLLGDALRDALDPHAWR